MAEGLSDHILYLYNELTEGTKYVHGECNMEVSDTSLIVRADITLF